MVKLSGYVVMYSHISGEVEWLCCDVLAYIGSEVKSVGLLMYSHSWRVKLCWLELIKSIQL